MEMCHLSERRWEELVEPLGFVFLPVSRVSKLFMGAICLAALLRPLPSST